MIITRPGETEASAPAPMPRKTGLPVAGDRGVRIRLPPLIDQLKEVYIDSQLETIDTTNWYPKVMRKDYTVGLNLTGSYVDDPDDNFYRNYTCGAEMNYSGYCNPDVDKLIDRQSVESDQQNRQKLVWEIERKLAEDGARPIIYYGRGATCWQPRVKGLTVMVNSIVNGWRMEDVWLDK